MAFIFFLSILLIIYCYAGYPVLLYIFSLVIRPRIKTDDITPTVSVVISVWNEEDVIEEKIENFLSLDYPEDKMEILIGSDGSTDKTNEVIQKFEDRGVVLVANEKRQGKALTNNELVNRAKNEIVIFTDARQKFEKDAIKQLVKNFADEKIGCVSGELVFTKGEGGTAKGINLYWNYEKYIRTFESRMHSMLGATGAIYAIRRKLFTQIPGDVVLDDMFVPLKIIQKGYRAIFDDSAKAYDKVADSPKEEYRRKARTLYGNYQIFSIMPVVFIPIVSSVAVQMFSHKLLRVLVPFLMIIAFLTNLMMFHESFFIIVFVLQILFYAMAFFGALASYKKYGMLNVISKLCYVPYVFCLLNFAAFVGFLRFLKGGQEITWQKARTT